MRGNGTPIKYYYQYTIVFEPTKEGAYIVTCPALPGLMTSGQTVEQARLMAADAIRRYLVSLQRVGLPFPIENDLPLAEKVEIAVDPE